MYDATRPGAVLCTLSVEADLKEPVSALKARMLEAAREAGIMVDGQERCVPNRMVLTLVLEYVTKLNLLKSRLNRTISFLEENVHEH